MQLKGKFVRREGTLLIFGSKNKREWKPIEASGQVDINGLEQGKYYTLWLNDNRLTNYELLPPRESGGSGQTSSGATAGPAPLTANCIMTNATSVLTSLLGAAVDYEKAEGLALRWGRLWGPAPFPDSRQHSPPAGWTSPTQYTNALPQRDPDDPGWAP